MSTKNLTFLIITALSYTTSTAVAADSTVKTVQVQKSDNVTQTTQQGHNFNNIGGDVNIKVEGISRKQYRDDLNALEKELKQKHEKTIAQLKAAQAKDDQQHLEQNKHLQETELNALRTKVANLEDSYQQRVDTLQTQINDLNEYSALFSDEELRKAQVALAKGDTSKAKEIFTKITQLAKVMDKQAAKAEYNLGKMAEENIDYRGAFLHYKEAAKRDEHNPEYLVNAGNLARTIAKYDKAIGYYKSALAIQIGEKGTESAEVAALWSTLGLVSANKGNYDTALEFYDKALKVYVKTFGEEHPDVAKIWDNLGNVWLNKGNYIKAIEYYDKALVVNIKYFGENHPSVAKNWNNLGIVWATKKDYDKAIGLFEKALAVDIKNLGKGHPNVARDWNNLGLAWASKGDSNIAIGYYEKALAVDIKAFGENHPRVAIDRNNLGLSWSVIGDPIQAISYYEKALSVFQKLLGDNHPYTIKTINNLNIAKQKLAESQKP